MDLKQYNMTLDAKAVLDYTPEGFLSVPAVLTRAGVFDYPERGRKELRPADEVFNKDSMDSIVGKSITFLHPEEMVDVRNVKKYEIGTVLGPVEKVDNFLKAKLVFKDQDAIEFIEKSRKRKEDVQLSCGYFDDDDPTPGEHEGEKYDVVQRNIRYNHIAIVAQGRAGKDVRLILDHKVNNNDKNGGTMKKNIKAVKFDAIGLDLPELNIETEKPEEIVTAMSIRLDAMDAGLVKQATILTEKQKTIDEQKAKLDSAAAEKTAMQKTIDELSDINGEHFKKGVALRKSLDEAAEDLGVKLDGLDVKASKVAIIEATFDGAKMDGKTDDYINARFDTAIELLNKRKNADNAAHLRKNGEPKKDGDDKPVSRQAAYDAVHKNANNKE